MSWESSEGLEGGVGEGEAKQVAREEVGGYSIRREIETHSMSVHQEGRGWEDGSGSTLLAKQA